MTPLTPEFIALILHYIVPPSQLSPLPPHLLSSSLRQRHHFLQISPDHPASYLAWPSNSHLAIHLLEDVPKPIDDISFPVRYTSDAESAYAHVSILPEHPHGLRLVFQWNSPDGWKYHNLALMPFPPHSSESPQDTLQQSDPEYIRMGDQVDTDAAYWDAYTHPDEDAPPITVADSDPQRGAEDSYWSQYAAIHGEYRLFTSAVRVHLCYRLWRLYSVFPRPEAHRPETRFCLVPWSASHNSPQSS